CHLRRARPSLRPTRRTRPPAPIRSTTLPLPRAKEDLQQHDDGRPEIPENCPRFVRESNPLAIQLPLRMAKHQTCQRLVKSTDRTSAQVRRMAAWALIASFHPRVAWSLAMVWEPADHSREAWTVGPDRPELVASVAVPVADPEAFL